MNHDTAPVAESQAPLPAPRSIAGLCGRLDALATLATLGSTQLEHQDAETLKRASELLWRHRQAIQEAEE